MSRIGVNPVPVPAGTEVLIDGSRVTARGAQGENTATLPPEVEVSREGDRIRVRPRDESRRARTMWGTSRSIVNNLVTGVSSGFSKTLLINGVGYRAAVQGRSVNLQLGFSHEVVYRLPDGIEAKCENPTTIVISGCDKQAVGQVAAEIRAFRKPEPYKGKGIRYADEHIVRKEGKKK